MGDARGVGVPGGTEDAHWTGFHLDREEPILRPKPGGLPVHKSSASIPRAWARRNSLHAGPDRCGAGRRSVARSSMRILVADIRTPRFSSSSAIRMHPHLGLGADQDRGPSSSRKRPAYPGLEQPVAAVKPQALTWRIRTISWWRNSTTSTSLLRSSEGRRGAGRSGVAADDTRAKSTDRTSRRSGDPTHPLPKTRSAICVSFSLKPATSFEDLNTSHVKKRLFEPPEQAIVRSPGCRSPQSTVEHLIHWADQLAGSGWR